MKKYLLFILILIQSSLFGQGFFPTYSGGGGYPSVTTTAITDIAATTATSGGNVLTEGGSAVTVSGVCWNTTLNPIAMGDSKTTDGSGVGSFVSSITGLTTGTTYYVRAYATNTTGTAYGDNISFTPTGPAEVTTNAVTSIAYTSATGNGNITGDGGSPVTGRGTCWNFYTNPTTSDYKTSDGSGTGSFTSSMTSNIYADYKYYVRAYAINGAGTTYGNEVNFITPCNAVPVVAGISIVSKVGTTVTLNAILVSSANATKVGVCYTSSGTPTISDAHTEVTVSELAPNSTVQIIVTGITGAMYWRTYATSSCGTGYHSATPYYY